MKKILTSVLNKTKEAEQAYVRMMREYSTVKEKPGTSDKVRKYINDIRDMAFQEIGQIINSEKDAIIQAAKFKATKRDTAGEIRRNNELILMKSAIDGTSKEELVDLAKKYVNTAYEEDFRIMIKPKMKDLLEENSQDRPKNIELVGSVMAALDSIPDDIKPELEYIDSLQEGIKNLLFFNTKNFPFDIRVTEDGRILHGNCISRNIELDIINSNEDFNPLNESIQEPLVTMETYGQRNYKTVKYQFNWEE